MPLYFGGSGVTATLKLPSNAVSLPSGATWLIPAGWWFIKPGGLTAYQEYDQILQTWRTVGGGSITSGSLEYVWSDGVNFRLANLTGCAVGAIVTTAGSAYTSAPTVTASAGSSVWRAVVGGSISTTVTMANQGSGYTYPPTVFISAPPAGGVPATAHATLSSGLVSVTVDNQGAGYPSPPVVTFINDPREGLNNVALGTGAAAVTTLTGSGTVTAVICVDPGVGGQTSTPTLSFSGGGGSSAAATALMCYTITAYTPTAGTGFTGDSLLSAIDKITASSATTNPAITTGWVKTKQAQIIMPESGGAPTATGAKIIDGGIYTNTSPDPLVTTNGALITQTVTIAFTMGGATDTSFISS